MDSFQFMQSIEDFIQRNKIGMLNIAILLLVVFGVKDCIDLNRNRPLSDDEKKEMAYSAAKDVVVKILKAPSTAKFQDFDYSLVTKNASEYTISSYVDSKNAFGVMLRNRFVITLDESGDEWLTKNFIIDGKKVK